MKIKIILITAIAMSILVGFTTLHSDPTNEAGIKVTILYPNGEGNTFDMEYYSEKHMPMVMNLLGETMTGYSIHKGLSGRPGEPATYMAIGYLHFNSVEDYGKVFGPNAQKILEDIPNYTNVQPTVQISQVVK